jgi:hypothetical protein
VRLRFFAKSVEGIHEITIVFAASTPPSVTVTLIAAASMS